jgi:hypothetical protein
MLRTRSVRTTSVIDMIAPVVEQACIVMRARVCVCCHVHISLQVAERNFCCGALLVKKDLLAQNK